MTEDRLTEGIDANGAFLESVLSSVPDAMVVVDPRGKILCANPQVEKMFGYAPGGLRGRSVDTLVPLGHRAQHAHHRATYAAEPQVRQMGSDLELYALHADGHEFPVEISLSSTEITGGPAVFAAIRDLTARRRARDAQQQQERRFQFLVEATRAVPWEASITTWLFTYVGPRAVELLGYPLEDWYGKDFWMDHIHPDDRGHAVSLCVDLSTQCDDFDFDYRMVAADGRIVWIHDIVHVRRVAGEPERLQGFLNDVTEQKTAERNLSRAASEITSLKDRLEDLYENAPDMFASVDVRTTNVIRCNKTTATRLGYAKEEIIDRPIFALYHPDCLDAAKTAFDLFVETGELRNIRLQLMRKDGSKLDVTVNSSAVRDDDGTILYSRSIWRDA